MKRALSVAALLVLAGSAHSRTYPSDITEYMKRGQALYARGDYAGAISAYRKASSIADVRQDECSAAWLLNAEAAAHFRLFLYRPALQTYLAAREKAERCGDRRMLGHLSVNISSLYLRMENLEQASVAAGESLRYFNRESNSPFRASALINRGWIAVRAGRTEDAIGYYLEGLEDARRHFDPSDRSRLREGVNTQIVAWGQLGRLLLDAGKFEQAEHALVEAYRLQRISGFEPTDVTYRNLALLAQARGNSAEAALLMDRALEVNRHSPRVPALALHHERAKLRLANGDESGALADYRRALELIRAYRLNVLPADTFRQSTENHLQEVYDEFLSLAARISYERNDRQLALITFQVAEENRAASLRALERTPEEWQLMLPADYWSTLVQLHNEEGALLRLSDSQTAEKPPILERISRLNARLTEQELHAGLAVQWGDTPVPDVLAATRAKLPPGSALLSIHLGERVSHLWALTGSQFRYLRLPPKKAIWTMARQFRDAVAANDPSATDTGRRLYQALFSGLPVEIARQPHWLLALDSDLLRTPLGALVTSVERGVPRYLVESHTLRLTPGALAFAGAPQSTVERPTSLLAVGDAIYNHADLRSPVRPPPSASSSGLIPALFARPAVAGGLPRLAGSGREVDQCARVWRASGATVSVLTAGDANPAGVIAKLAQRPSVLHIAAHFLPSPAGREESHIALSVDAAGTPQLLAPRDVQALGTPIRTVVLNGCGSGNGAAPSASGLLGLTRAWLASGSRHVVSTLWPAADDGELFVHFYRHLLSGPPQEGTPAEPIALQRAQVELLRSRTWRSQPRHWAAYFLISKD
ncbi:MAG: CHAT domain-containing tetratricopeptide repeat protein [Bryobacteraceae bacterium]|nr:CHAT domain-containing tetratricopeptide repeat protein [Bryobacteraceae bacterium]